GLPILAADREPVLLAVPAHRIARCRVGSREPPHIEQLVPGGLLERSSPLQDSCDDRHGGCGSDRVSPGGAGFRHRRLSRARGDGDGTDRRSDLVSDRWTARLRHAGREAPIMMFSIIIPTHNSNDTLRIALRSCLNQTNGDFEIIVIDDASNEPAAIVCANLEDRRITCLTNPTNLGASASRNRGLEAARGDYIVFLDADDIYLPHKLEVLARTIQREQPGVLLHRQFRLHGKSDGRISWSELPARRWDGQTPLEEFTFRGGDYYNINVLCVSRLILQNVRFRPESRMLEDRALVYYSLRA